MLSPTQFQARPDYAYPVPNSHPPEMLGRQFGDEEPGFPQASHALQQQRRQEALTRRLPPLVSPMLGQQDQNSDAEVDDAGNSPIESNASEGRPHEKKGAANNPVRKRTSRACDSCNQLRTKCDGKNPCSHCTETGVACGYARVPKKRGKVSKKDLARQAALKERAAAVAAADAGRSDHDSMSTNGAVVDMGGNSFANGVNGLAHPTSQPRLLGNSVGESFGENLSPGSNSHQSGLSDGQPLSTSTTNLEAQYQAIPISPFGTINTHVVPDGSPLSDFRTSNMDFSNLYMGMGGLPGHTLPLEGMDFAINSPSAATSTSGHNAPPSVKHPVLLPLFPFLRNIMAPALAYELLEHFFTSASSEFPHPASPYHITTVFRKKSFIGQESPRKCSPALLASMLWGAAWTSDARALTSPPSARARLCQKLLNLCIFLLNPLVHGDRIGKGAPDAERNGVSKAHPMGVQEMLTNEDVPVKIASGTLDDVVTYMHIAIVVSASEDKGASLRWWTAAWNLAKELRMGRELDANARTRRSDSFFMQEARSDRGGEMELDPQDLMSEEEREERRRVWWTLYLVDRHLSLCYNRQLSLHDSECVHLLRPMEEMAWQEGQFDANLQSQYSWLDPRAADRFAFTGPSTFGYFLPISTILGEIIDMHHRRMHPYLPQAKNSSGDLHGYDAEVRDTCHKQLRTYEKSMMDYRNRHLPPVIPGSDPGRRPRLTEGQYQVATALAYGEHLMHVMYILLYDRWDPATLLADEDCWTSTPAFGQAMTHAIRGADAVAEVLQFDPQVGFIPYLYGIYLLQGSFLLLVMADRLAMEANEQMITACETIVRAHEACVVTLNTEYQRAFRRCMQSALAQVRGRMPQDGGEQQRRRRETLSLYRWIGDGGGLAV